MLVLELFSLMEIESRRVGIAPEQLPDAFGSHETIADAASDATERLMRSIDHLTPQQRKAVFLWAGDNMAKGRYREINDHLRKGTPIPGDLQRAIKHLNAMINAHPLPHEVDAYRGLHPPMSHAIGQLAVGQSYSDQGFTSWTISPVRAAYFAKQGRGGVFMHIHLPRGVRAIYLGHPELTPFAEYEILLPPDASIRYLGQSMFRHPGAGEIPLYHFAPD